MKVKIKEDWQIEEREDPSRIKGGSHQAIDICNTGAWGSREMILHRSRASRPKDRIVMLNKMLPK